MKSRIAAVLSAATVAAGVALFVPAVPAAAAAGCAPSWDASATYTGGKTTSYDGHNWSARQRSHSQAPGHGAAWSDLGTCAAPGANGAAAADASAEGFVVSEAQFNQMFPNRNAFYTYSGLTAALSAYPEFANTGSDTVKRQEAAAFLANVSHETGGLVHIVEQNTGNYPHYCDASQPYGCPAGQAAYYGRGPIQLSWNFNYKAAGDALGIDLLNNPYLVEQDSAVAWKTALWYWNTQTGPGTMTPHQAMVSGAGFGETIRSINGSIECNGGNPDQVQSRINSYQNFVQILGTTPGGNLSC
ncbi:glycoside hydrolase family 19 protein [Streptomyces sp. Pv4-95]|uniref:glycoside hydrolase family 19 protein n=1 Tax=Streptomyces sp. Pv4-95 TaxID=3049543 RepID=UPI0038911D7E